MFLRASYDPRFCGPTQRAEENIHNGVRGDALAAFESFAHVIWKLNEAGDIQVTDTKPFPKVSTPVGRNVHRNLDLCLGQYAEALADQDQTAMAKQWSYVEQCFLGNGFTEHVQTTVCKAVYRALVDFVDKATIGADEDALVLVRANPKMAYRDEDIYGGFGKRGNAQLEAAAFSRQVWTVFSKKTDEPKEVKIKRAVGAVFTMASKA